MTKANNNNNKISKQKRAQKEKYYFCESQEGFREDTGL